MPQNFSLNDTLEEKLRLELCDQQKHIVRLETELSLKDKLIAEETAGKYAAYKRINELQQEITRLKEAMNAHY
jgi:phage host-nuclease inhibitor protein Gam